MPDAHHPYDYGDVVHVRRGQRLYRAYLVDVGLESLVIRYPSGYTTSVPRRCASVVRQRTLQELVEERRREDERLRLPDWEPPSLPLREVETIERALPAMPDEVGGSIVGADVWRTLGLKTTTKHRRKQ